MNPVAAIRPAQATDIDRLVMFSKRTIRARYTSFLGDDAVEGFIANGAVEQYYEENLARCFVVEEEGVILGAGAYKELTVDLMMIDADHQGRGLGSRLLDHLETLLFDKSSELTLESFRDNQQANAFYHNRGWETIGSYDDKELGIPMIRLSKRKA